MWEKLWLACPRIWMAARGHGQNCVGSLLQTWKRLPVYPQKDGELFASRVRRERLSVDHYMILNYDILKDHAAKKGYRWTRPATRAEALEKWIADVKALGVKARRETVSAEEMDKYFERLRQDKNK